MSRTYNICLKNSPVFKLLLLVLLLTVVPLILTITWSQARQSTNYIFVETTKEVHRTITPPLTVSGDNKETRTSYGSIEGRVVSEKEKENSNKVTLQEGYSTGRATQETNKHEIRDDKRMALSSGGTKEAPKKNNLKEKNRTSYRSNEGGAVLEKEKENSNKVTLQEGYSTGRAQQGTTAHEVRVDKRMALSSGGTKEARKRNELKETEDSIYSRVSMLVAAFTEQDIPVFLDAGSVLGSLRHFGVIPLGEEKDVDLMLVSTDRRKIEGVLKKLNLNWKISKDKGKPSFGYHIDTPYISPGSVSALKKKRVYIDLWLYQRKNGVIECVGLNGVGCMIWWKAYFMEPKPFYPEEWFFPAVMAPFGPYMLPIPARASFIMLHKYGDTWLTHCGGWDTGKYVCSGLYGKLPFVFRSPSRKPGVEYHILKIGNTVKKVFRVVNEKLYLPATMSDVFEDMNVVNQTNTVVNTDTYTDVSDTGRCEPSCYPHQVPRHYGHDGKPMDLTKKFTRYCQVNCQVMTKAYPSVCSMCECGSKEYKMNVYHSDLVPKLPLLFHYATRARLTVE